MTVIQPVLLYKENCVSRARSRVQFKILLVSLHSCRAGIDIYFVKSPDGAVSKHVYRGLDSVIKFLKLEICYRGISVVCIYRKRFYNYTKNVTHRTQFENCILIDFFKACIKSQPEGILINLRITDCKSNQLWAQNVSWQKDRRNACRILVRKTQKLNWKTKEINKPKAHKWQL